VVVTVLTLKLRLDTAVADAGAARAALEVRAEHDRLQQAQLASLHEQVETTRTQVGADAERLRALSASDETLNVQLQSAREIVDQLREDLRRFTENVGPAAHTAATTPTPDLATRDDDAGERGRAVPPMLLESLRPLVQSGQASLLVRGSSIVIRLPSDALFDATQGTIRPEGQHTLAQVGAALTSADWDHGLQVAAYSDGTPPRAPFSSSWQSTAAQATLVLGFLRAHGVRSSTVSVAGYGTSDPIADNADPVGRAENRRVEVVLGPSSDECEGRGLRGARAD
jgi:chemotaxis protein MotB